MRSYFAGAFVCILAFAVQPACADQLPASSLFFTPGEIKTIEMPPESRPQTAVAPLPDIHLGAVLYYGPGNWAIWLDGERWTPETSRADMQITDVRSNEVRLAWSPTPGAEPRVITLRSYQTYRTASGKVVEGMR